MHFSSLTLFLIKLDCFATKALSIFAVKQSSLFCSLYFDKRRNIARETLELILPNQDIIILGVYLINLSSFITDTVPNQAIVFHHKSVTYLHSKTVQLIGLAQF
jgi:hypothetical protein